MNAHSNIPKEPCKSILFEYSVKDGNITIEEEFECPATDILKTEEECKIKEALQDEDESLNEEAFQDNEACQKGKEEALECPAILIPKTEVKCEIEETFQDEEESCNEAFKVSETNQDKEEEVLEPPEAVFLVPVENDEENSGAKMDPLAPCSESILLTSIRQKVRALFPAKQIWVSCLSPTIMQVRESVTMKSSIDHCLNLDDSGYCNEGEPIRKRAKTAKERVHEYRQRKKAQSTLSPKSKGTAQSGAERTRKYRQRKKEQSASSTLSKSIALTAKERMRKYRQRKKEQTVVPTSSWTV